MTANEVFELTMALLDELNNSGGVNTSTTLMYRLKAPIFINLGQMDIFKSSEISKSFDTIFDTDRDDWTLISMPSDFKELVEIIEIDENSNVRKVGSYRWEGQYNLYIDMYFMGTIRVVYKYIPTQITSLDDVLELDNMDSTTMLSHYLAAYLLLEENPNLSNFYMTQYIEAKNKVRTKRAFSPTQDMYGYLDS